jgi:hypothetical protein
MAKVRNYDAIADNLTYIESVLVKWITNMKLLILSLPYDCLPSGQRKREKGQKVGRRVNAL